LFNIKIDGKFFTYHNCWARDMKEIRVKARWRNEQHRWSTSGSKITSPESLGAIRDAIDRDVIIVEHWVFCGASSPTRMVFDDFDDFVDYIQNKSSGGDAIDIWLMHDHCKPENRFLEGKIPDEDGCIPKKGAY